MSAKTLLQLLDRTLAFAHAAVDEPTLERISMARSHAEAVLPSLRRADRIGFTLAEARQIVFLVTQLKRVLRAVSGTNQQVIC